MIELVDATPELIMKLKDNLREADEREITSFGWTKARGVWRSFKSSIMNTIALVDGQVGAGWGVSGVLLSGEAAPWLLTTPVCETISPRLFVRIYRDQLDRFHSVFPVLSNYVAADYTKAQRLLVLSGFTLGEPEKLGHGYFRKFRREKI